MSRKIGIEIDGANVRYDAAKIGQLDAYCQVQCGVNLASTDLCMNAGSTPHWGFNTTFEYNNEPVVTFTVMDKERYTADNCVASGTLMVAEALAGRQHLACDLPLFGPMGPAGDMRVRVQLFETPSGWGQPPAEPAHPMCLQVVVRHAFQLAQVDWNVNPYVEVRVGSHKQRTPTAVGGGTQPAWDHTMLLPYSGEGHMEVVIKDDETYEEDKFMGTCTFNLTDVFGGAAKSYKGSLNIDRYNEPAGLLAVELAFGHFGPANDFVPWVPGPF